MSNHSNAPCPPALNPSKAQHFSLMTQPISSLANLAGRTSRLLKGLTGLLLCSAAALTGATDITQQGAFYPAGLHGNGVIRVEMNGEVINGVKSPMITRMWVGDTVVVPKENAGAGFQLASRGEGGNKYNPTQGGDCKGRTPILGTAYLQNFQPVASIAATHGTLFGLTPLLYQGDQTGLPGTDPLCTGPVVESISPAPYYFHFGAVLGDGSVVPREAMLLYMAINKTHSAAPHLSKYLTEAPAIFLAPEFAYAYAAVGKPELMQFLPLIDGLTMSNDVRRWSKESNQEMRATNLIMQCNQPLDSATLCIALYSDFGVKGVVSRRSGSAGQPDLIYMGLTGAPACNPVADALCNAVKDNTNWITDTRIHTLSRILAVGRPETVRAAITQTLNAVPITANVQW